MTPRSRPACRPVAGWRDIIPQQRYRTPHHVVLKSTQQVGSTATVRAHYRNNKPALILSSRGASRTDGSEANRRSTDAAVEPFAIVLASGGVCNFVLTYVKKVTGKPASLSSW